MYDVHHVCVCRNIPMYDNQFWRKMAYDIKSVTEVLAERKKMSLIDWLNDNKQPEETFSQWVNGIIVTEKDFQYISIQIYLLQVC